MEENSRRRGRGSRDSIRHANVSWPLHRQREGNTFRGRNAKVGSSMRLVASLQYFRFNDPLLAILSAGGMDRGHKDDSRILLWGGENRWVISFNLYVSLDDYWQLWEIKGWLMNRFSTDIGWIAIYLDLLSNHLNLERKIFFFLLVTESISFYGWSWNSWTSSTWRMSFSKKKWAASVDRNKFR